MSAAPNLPPNLGPHEVPRSERRRPAWATALRWIVGILLTLVVVVIITVVVLLRSTRFHGYVLRMAQTQATDALGTRVRFRDYRLHISGLSPTLDVYNVTVDSAAVNPSIPLLQVDHARVGVRVVSLLRKKWYLNNVEVHHPVLHVLVAKDGTTNLPKPKSSGKSNTSIFDLAVRHTVLDDGVVFLNDRKNALNADLSNLDLRAVYDSSRDEYSGKLGYSNGHVKYGAYAPMPHDMQASFAATRQKILLRDARLRVGRSELRLRATADDYSTAPRVHADYTASLDAGELRRVLNSTSVPAGTILSSGSLEYADVPGKAALDSMTAQGRVSSSQLSLRSPSLKTDIRDLDARYILREGNLSVRDLRAQVLGGELTGEATVRDVAGAARSSLRASLHGVSLQQLNAITNTSGPNSFRLTGTADADITATGSKSLKDLQAAADLTVNAMVSQQNGTASLPVAASVHGKYSGRAETVTLTNSVIHTPQTLIRLDGTMSTRSALNVQMHSNDLHEFETIAAIVQSPKQGAQPMDLHGRADFKGVVQGSTKAPAINGQFTARDLRYKESSWRNLSASIAASPSKISVQNGLLVPQAGGRVSFSLATDAKNWKPTETTPFTVALDISGLDIHELARVAGHEADVSGSLNGNVRLSGTQLNPVGHGQLSLKAAKLMKEVINATVQFRGDGNTVHSTLALQMRGGNAQGNVTYFPKQKAYQAQFSANNFKIDKLAAVEAKQLGLSGTININATGQGTIDNPGMQATVEVPKLQVHDQTISNLVLKTDISNHLAKVTLDSDVVNSHVQGRGTIALTGDYNTDLTLDTARIPLEPLVNAYAPEHAGSVKGVTELHATIRGPLKNKALLEAHAVVPELAVSYGNAVQLSSPGPIRLDYAKGVLNLQRGALRGTGTDLQFQGTVPIVDRTAPMSLLLLGTIDLRLIQLFDPDVTSSGQLRMEINSYGNTSNPDVQGQIRVLNASLATRDAPLGLQNGNGVLTLTRDRILISDFTGKVGGGTVRAGGGVLYKPSLQFDLALKGTGMRLLYPPGVRSGIDANLSLTGTTENARLQGAINVDQLSLTPDFDFTSVAGSMGGTTVAPPAQGFSSNLQLDLAVRSTSGINLVSRDLSLQGSANLNVRGTAAQPVVLGRINLTGGDLIFRNNRYVLQGGTIEFSNPAQTQPSLNVNVSTTVDQYNIAMRFEGPVERLRTSYTSDPALPPSDIINLLAFGKTSEAQAANPNPPGNLGAESAIASAVSGQVTSRVEKLAGISRLSIDPTLGQGSNKGLGATVTIQQRVTGKIFVTFSSDVSSTQNQTIQLQYQQSPRLSFSGTRDQNGGFAFDVRIRREW